MDAKVDARLSATLVTLLAAAFAALVIVLAAGCSPKSAGPPELGSTRVRPDAMDAVPAPAAASDVGPGRAPATTASAASAGR